MYADSFNTQHLLKSRTQYFLRIADGCGIFRRIAFLLEKPVTDDTTRKKVILNLIGLFGEASDNSCSNADRVFYGTNHCVDEFDITGDTVDVETVLNLSGETKKETASESKWSKPSGIVNFDCAQFDAKVEDLLSLIDPNEMD